VSKIYHPFLKGGGSMPSELALLIRSNGCAACTSIGLIMRALSFVGDTVSFWCVSTIDAMPRNHF